MLRAAPDPVLPHPRAHLRAFVLVPLLDVAPDWVHPVLGRSGRDLLAELPPQGVRADLTVQFRWAVSRRSQRSVVSVASGCSDDASSQGHPIRDEARTPRPVLAGAVLHLASRACRQRRSGPGGERSGEALTWNG